MLIASYQYAEKGKYLSKTWVSILIICFDFKILEKDDSKMKNPDFLAEKVWVLAQPFGVLYDYGRTRLLIDVIHFVKYITVLWIFC